MLFMCYNLCIFLLDHIMNIISRFFKDSTPEDPIFNYFIQTFEQSIRKSRLLLNIIVAIFIGILIGFFFSYSSNSGAWIINFCIVTFFLVSLLVTIINNFKVKDYVLENLSKVIIYNQEAFIQVKNYISTQGYITVAQLDEFISQENKKRKIHYNEDKRGAKAILEK